MSMLGLKHNAETKRKMSGSQIGNKNAEGHIVSRETREKMSAALRGKRHEQSVETRAKISASLRGHRNNPESYEKSAASCRGAKNYRWKGGKTIIRGYVYLKRPNHPRASKRGYVAEHHLVMEARLGRILLPNEIPHHVNGNPADNRDENLFLFSSIGEHIKFHKTQEEQL